MEAPRTAAELENMQKLTALTDELMAAGVSNITRGVTARRKVETYLFTQTGAQLVQFVSAAQWAKFWRHIDGLRFDLPGLARYIETLSPQTRSPLQTPDKNILTLTVEDKAFLKSVGISEAKKCST